MFCEVKCNINFDRSNGGFGFTDLILKAIYHCFLKFAHICHVATIVVFNSSCINEGP